MRQSTFTARLNPEFVRLLRTSLTPKRAAFIAIATFTLLAVGGLLLWNSWLHTVGKYNSYDTVVRRFGDDAFDFLTVALLGLLFVLAPATAALSFVQERVRGTAIFQQMSLLRPFDLVLGKLLGSSVLSYFIAALILPCYLAAARIGHVGTGRLLRFCLLLLVGGFCCQAVGLFVSAALAGPAERALRGGLLIGPVVGGAGAVVAVATGRIFDSAVWRNDLNIWSFYGHGIYPYQIVLGLMAFVGVWALVGTVRQVKAGQLITTGPRIVWLFFASVETLLVGLCWGWEQYARTPYYDAPPYNGLLLYLAVNLLALLLLASSSALRRGRLREWWSTSRDPLSVLQRREIKHAWQTYLIALLLAEVGLGALWASYHLHLTSFPANLSLTTQLLPVALGFAGVSLGLAALTQFCALQRFRLGGWAGALCAGIFCLVMLAASASFEDKNNTPTLINPLTYVAAIYAGDAYVDNTTPAEYLDQSLRAQVEYKRGVGWNDRAINWRKRPTAALLTTMTLHGLLAQTLLGLLCCGALALKWRATHAAILQER